MRATHACLYAVTLALLVAASEAQGQTITSPYRFIDRKRDFGVFVGYIFTDRGQAGLGPESGEVFGVQGALRLSDPIHLGLYLGYFPSTRDVIQPSGPDAPQVIGQESLNLVLLGGRFQFQLTGSRSWHNLMPYFIGGIGVAFDAQGTIDCSFGGPRPQCQLLPRERFNFGTSFLGQIGIGTVWIPRERIGLRAVLQDNIWKLNTPVGYYDPGSEISPVPPTKDWTNNIEISLALSYWF